MPTYTYTGKRPRAAANMSFERDQDTIALLERARQAADAAPPRRTAATSTTDRDAVIIDREIQGPLAQAARALHRLGIEESMTSTAILIRRARALAAELQEVVGQIEASSNAQKQTFMRVPQDEIQLYDLICSIALETASDPSDVEVKCAPTFAVHSDRAKLKTVLAELMRSGLSQAGRGKIIVSAIPEAFTVRVDVTWEKGITTGLPFDISAARSVARTLGGSVDSAGSPPVMIRFTFPQKRGSDPIRTRN